MVSFNISFHMILHLCKFYLVRLFVVVFFFFFSDEKHFRSTNFFVFIALLSTGREHFFLLAKAKT